VRGDREFALLTLYAAAALGLGFGAVWLCAALSVRVPV
jgi:hypothetical protein